MSLRRWVAISLAPIIVLTVASYRLPVASAFIGFQPVSPEELKMTKEPLAQGHRRSYCFAKWIEMILGIPPMKTITFGSRY